MFSRQVSLLLWNKTALEFNFKGSPRKLKKQANKFSLH